MSGELPPLFCGCLGFSRYSRQSQRTEGTTTPAPPMAQMAATMEAVSLAGRRAVVKVQEGYVQSTDGGLGATPANHANAAVDRVLLKNLCAPSR